MMMTIIMIIIIMTRPRDPGYEVLIATFTETFTENLPSSPVQQYSPVDERPHALGYPQVLPLDP